MVSYIVKRLTIFCGDLSSDVYAAEVARCLPDFEISGIGGPNLAKYAEVLDFSPLCVVGLFEIIKNIRAILKLRRQAFKLIETTESHTVLLLDCPGFNMSLLPKLKKHRIIYAIPPQIWAWHTSRVNKLKKYCEEVWVLYDFEVDFYAKYGITAKIVKHPLLDKSHLQERKLYKEQGLKIALLPGSRILEHEKVMPYFLNLVKNFPEIEWIWVLSSPFVLDKWQVSNTVLGLENLPDVHAAIAVSGTVTLELALMRIPAVVVYKLSWLTGLLAKCFIKVKYVALPNILLDKEVYKELLQNDLTDDNLLKAFYELLDNRALMYEELLSIRKHLNSTALTLSELLLNYFSARGN